MTLPTLKVEIAFATDPTLSPTWVDVSAYVRAASSMRGRQYETDETSTGTLALALDNRDRRFDPLNTAGPYYGYLLPMRRVRLTLAWAGIEYPVFAGYVETWPLNWALGYKDATVQVTASDGLAVLALARITASYPQELTGARVTQILTDASWTVGSSWVLGSATNSQVGVSTIVGPVGDRLIDAGVSAMQAQNLDDVTALDALRAVQKVENGTLFVNAGGAVVFRSRRYRTVNVASLLTLGDAAGECPYRNPTIGYDVSRVRNSALVQRLGSAVTHTASDATSRARYFLRSEPRTDLPLAHAEGEDVAEVEAAALADWLVYRYKAPELRVLTVEPLGMGHEGNWPGILARDLTDRVTLRARPPGGTGTVTQESIVEGIAVDWRPGSLTCKWQLSPAETLVGWQLGTSQYSQVGVSTTVTY